MGLSLFAVGSLLAHGAAMMAGTASLAARTLGDHPLPWHVALSLIGLLPAVGLFRQRTRSPFPEAYQGVLEALADGVVLLDSAGVVVEANPAALSTLNLDHAELIGRRLGEAVPETPLGQALLAVCEGEGSHEQHVHSGEQAVSVRAVPLPAAPGGRLIILHDATDEVAARLERESLLRQVRSERERLGLLLRNTSDAIIVLDTYGRVRLGNRPAQQLLAVERAERLPPVLHAVIERARQENRPQQAELKLDEQIYLVSATPLTGEGESSGIVVTLRDVTPFRLLTQFKDEFISTITHDMRSPLTSLLGYAQIAQLETVSPEQRQDVLARIEKAAWRLSNLVNQLLDLAALQAQVEYDFSAVRLEALAHAAIEDLAAAAEERHLVIAEELDEPVLVEADPRLLAQVWLNLISNAIQFTERGTITVRVTTADGEALGQVIDTGIGVMPADLPYIFEKFYRGKMPYGDGIQGIGLGLALVKAIIERHHGRVWVESQLGAGSTLSFALPLLKSED